MPPGHCLAVGRSLDEPQAKTEGNAGAHQTKVHIVIVRHFDPNYWKSPGIYTLILQDIIFANFVKQPVFAEIKSRKHFIHCTFSTDYTYRFATMNTGITHPIPNGHSRNICPAKIRAYTYSPRMQEINGRLGVASGSRD